MIKITKEILSIKNLYVEYRSDDAIVQAVNDISFNLKPSETLAFVGETGAGKTTTALSIMGLLPERTALIKSGQILFKDKDIVRMSKKDIRNMRGSDISMIFQDPMTSLNPLISIGEQVRETLEIHNEDGKTKEELIEKTKELLRMVGIPEERYEDYPYQFSGGMKQRIVIAMALACNPEIIIADEPTTALDVTIQAQILKLIGNIRTNLGTAIILITHDLGVVAEFSDKVAIIYAGEIIEYGTVEEIFEGYPQHPYTKGLFGSIPDLQKREKRLRPIYGLMPDPTKLPQGCKFHPRCNERLDICDKINPLFANFGKSHKVACHLFNGEV